SIAAAFPFRRGLLRRNLLAIECRSSGGDVLAVSTAHDSRVGVSSRPPMYGRWLIAASRSWYLLRRFLSRLTLRLLSTDRETEMPLLYATGFHYAADERSIHPINSLSRDGRKAGSMIATANELQGNNVTLTKSFFLFYTRCVPSA
ncbi:unnamed protein product, partial [Musa hybrid cultivar]